MAPFPGQEMLVPRHKRATASLRGNAAAWLLWTLLLWTGNSSCRAQRAGGDATDRARLRTQQPVCTPIGHVPVSEPVTVCVRERECVSHLTSVGASCLLTNVCESQQGHVSVCVSVCENAHEGVSVCERECVSTCVSM